MSNSICPGMCEHKECARVRRDERRRRVRLEAAAPQLLESLRAMIDTANLVVARWEQGDLAGSVNELESVALDAREAVHKAVGQ